MGRLSYSIGVAVLFSSFLSGCAGIVVTTPTECSADVPLNNYIYQKDKWGPIKQQNIAGADDYIDKNYLPSKDEFIKIWGEPDEIVTISENEVILVYNRREWCGAVPAWVILVPLILPICDGFDRITFKGNSATHIHFKRVNEYGAIAGFPGMAEVFRSRICPSELEAPEKSQERTK